MYNYRNMKVKNPTAISSKDWHKKAKNESVGQIIIIVRVISRQITYTNTNTRTFLCT